MKAIGLAVVRKGVATVYAPRHVYVAVVDLDDIGAGDGRTMLPPGVGFEALVKSAGVEQYVEFEKPKGG